MLSRPAQMEIFSTKFEFRDNAAIDFPKYEYDYLSVGDASITVQKVLKAQEHDYIIISGEKGKIQGIISEVEFKNNTTVLKVRPLLELLDVDIFFKQTDKSMSIEEMIGTMIAETYVDSGDSDQNIEGLEISVKTKTNGIIGLEDELNIYSVCLEAMQSYRIAVEFGIDIMKRKLECCIGVPEAGIKTIECDLLNIIDSEVVFKEKNKAYNKAVIIGKYDDEESEMYGQIEKRVYYLGADGSITMEPKERITPVLWSIDLMSIDEEFETKAYEKAVSRLTKQNYNNYIKIEVRNDDPMVSKNKFVIGQEGRIIKNGIEYISVYTGYEQDKTTTLYFGLIRTEFTKTIRRHIRNGRN